MLTRQSMMALAVAVVLGLLAVYFANILLVGSQRRTAAAGTTRVAVAAVPIDFGTEITPDKIRFTDYPSTSIPPGAFQNATQLMPSGQKRFALMPISINEPILTGKISAPGGGASIAALLPDGMRAATVRINDVSGVAGFIQPNDSVDVLITRTVTGADRSAQVTDVLLQNVRVIAIDQEAKNADGTPKLAKTATLQVNPLDAQKLALAQEVGSLSLVLRKPGEANNPVVETISMNDLRYNMYGGARYPAPAVVGGYSGAIAGAIDKASALINNVNRPKPRVIARNTAKPAVPVDTGTDIQVYRGTTSNQYKVGGYGH
jgi:pilus assembly protein CpaB